MFFSGKLTFQQQQMAYLAVKLRRVEYAIVDIETTGGHASANGITEIAIVLHDGEKITGRYETLVNPHQLIPRYVEALTGISNSMVADAPSFETVAPRIFNLLDGKIFIAHNVNFDYSFVKYHLNKSGIEWQAPKLCTVRMSRKVFPGHPSYSLGKICRSLEIGIDHRHRAMGDAAATVQLWEKILATGGQEVVCEYLKRGTGEQSLPLYLDSDQIYSLPRIPGVYYFLDQKGEVIYVGKAVDLRKRVTSHFTNNKTGKQKQEFMRHVHQVKYVPVPSEIMAFLLEEAEIKRLWPRYNRSQKRPALKLGIFAYEDNRGYMRLAIERMARGRNPVYSFGLQTEGRDILHHLVNTFGLCPQLNHLSDCSAGGIAPCSCHLDPEHYNDKVTDAVNSLKQSLPSFAVIEPVSDTYPYIRHWNPPVGRKKSEGLFEETQPAYHSVKPARKIGNNAAIQSCILMEEGVFYGMGYVPVSVPKNVNTLKQYLVPYPDNDYLRGLVNRYAIQHPELVEYF